MCAQLDPRIGVLNSGLYYCFPQGNGKHEFIGTLPEVEAALGLRKSISLAKVEAKIELRQITTATPSSPRKIKQYLVTVTPKITTYGSHGANTAYSVEIDASTRTEAITKARQARNAEEGRYGVPAVYRAQLATK